MMEGTHIMHKIDWYIKPHVYVYDIFRRIWITICFTKHINVNDETMISGLNELS